MADSPSTPNSGEERRGSFRPSGPSPAGTEAERRFMGDKVHTLQLMVEQQHRVVEELKSQLARNNSKKTRTRLEAAVSQLAELEAQASKLRGSSNSPEKTLPGDSSQWPPSPPPRPDPTPAGPVGLPPPLPSRNSVSSIADLAAPLPPPRVPSHSLPPPPPSLLPLLQLCCAHQAPLLQFLPQGFETTWPSCWRYWINSALEFRESILSGAASTCINFASRRLLSVIY